MSKKSRQRTGIEGPLEAVRWTWRDKPALWRDALMLRVSEQEGLKPSGGLASRMGAAICAPPFPPDRPGGDLVPLRRPTRSTVCGWTSSVPFLRLLSRPPTTRSSRHSTTSWSTSAASCDWQPGDRLFDIGCGWGALVLAARRHGVRAHGITLSESQFEYARERIRVEGLQDSSRSSFATTATRRRGGLRQGVQRRHMFEHVGLANLPDLLRRRAEGAATGRAVPQPWDHPRRGGLEPDGRDGIHQSLRLPGRRVSIALATSSSGWERAGLRDP